MWLIWVKDLVKTGAGNDVQGRDGIVMGFGRLDGIWIRMGLGWVWDGFGMGLGWVWDGFGMGLGLG